METIKFNWTRGHICITPENQGEYPISFSFPIEIDFKYVGVGNKWKFEEQSIPVFTEYQDDDKEFYLRLEALKLARLELTKMFKDSVEKYHSK